jgi:ATP-dependent Lon protease
MAPSREDLERFRRKFGGDEQLRRYIGALYDLLANTLGAEKMVLRAGKLGALKLMRARGIAERLLALERLVFEDPTLERLPTRAQFAERIAQIENGLADTIAQRTVEETIDRKINAKMVTRHQEYLKELRLEALREDAGPETPASQKKRGNRETGESPPQHLGARRSASERPLADRRSRVRDRGVARQTFLALSAARHLVWAARRR